MKFEPGDVVVTPMRHLAQVRRFSASDPHYTLVYLDGPEAGEGVWLRAKFLRAANAHQMARAEQILEAIERVEGRT